LGVHLKSARRTLELDSYDQACSRILELVQEPFGLGGSLLRSR